MNESNLETKICTKCHKGKLLEEFSKGHDKNGLTSYCKKCISELGKIYREKNSEQIKERQRKFQKKYRENNSEKLAILTKRWAENNPEKINAANKKWRENNPGYYKEYRKKNSEKEKARGKKWAENNPKKTKESKKKWWENNREKVRLRKEKRYRNDSIYRLNHNISGGINRSLKGNKNGYHWESLVGYTLKDLKIHLEFQFKDGMTWGNKGKWHIDHKIPINKFNITSVECEDFKRCWALNNLQPLWRKDNLEKHDKILSEFAQLELYY